MLTQIKKWLSPGKSTKNNILDAWGVAWKNDPASRTEDEIFYETLRMAYCASRTKAHTNKCINFILKLVLIMTTLLFALLMLVGAPYFLLHSQRELPVMLAVIGTFGLGAAAFLRAIAKWIDVRKCQEAWARHRLNRHRLETEMLKYIYKLSPYSDGDPRYDRSQFISSILDILNENQLLFCTNLENKEAALNDLATSFQSAGQQDTALDTHH